MSFWLDKGWLRWKPTSMPNLNFIGCMSFEDPKHGGWRRLTGFGEGWVEILAINYERWRMTWIPGKFEDTVRLDLL